MSNVKQNCQNHGEVDISLIRTHSTLEITQVCNGLYIEDYYGFEFYALHSCIIEM